MPTKTYLALIPHLDMEGQRCDGKPEDETPDTIRCPSCGAIWERRANGAPASTQPIGYGSPYDAEA